NGQLCLSRVHGGVCWVSVGASRMCGMVYDVSTSLYRHMRREHHVNLRPNSRGNILISETVEGEQALLRYVRAQHWRNASFVREPGRGPIGGYIDRVCDDLERIAALDPVFADRYGTRFHRDNKPVTTPRGPSTPTHHEAPTTPTPAEKRRHLGMPLGQIVGGSGPSTA
ncbi:hypothetical protein N8T08_003764, partial [Aspergillus melleus]